MPRPFDKLRDRILATDSGTMHKQKHPSTGVLLFFYIHTQASPLRYDTCLQQSFTPYGRENLFLKLFLNNMLYLTTQSHQIVASSQICYRHLGDFFALRGNRKHFLTCHADYFNLACVRF